VAEDPFASIAEPVSAPGGADPFAAIAEPVQQDAQAPQTPGFYKRLVAPYDPGAEDSNVAVRALSAAGGAVLGTPGAVYHAFADEPTEEETKKYSGDTGGLKRVGLGLERLVVDPVESAVKDYASGKVTPRAALSVLPEALGVGVGSQAAGELGGRVLGKIKAPATPGELRESITKGLPEKAQRFARKVSGPESDLKRAVNKAAEDTAKAEGAHAEATETAAQRKTLAKTLDETSVKARQHIGKVEESVHKAADAKFDAVREKIGNPEVDPKPLTEAVTNAESNILQDIPENIKEFRAILGHGEELPSNVADAAEAHNIELEGPKPMSWDKLQSLKSRIDARLRQNFRGSARMNGDLVRALSSVQETIVDTMGELAEAHGAKDLWGDAKKTWREYKQDFHEGTGKEGSGSPVARALNAVDPARIRGPFTGSANSELGNRGVDILRKYPQHGGNEAATTVEEMLGHHENLRKMGADKAIKPVKAPVVDAEQVARDSIMRRAARIGDFNARDIGIIASSGVAEIVAAVLGADPKILGGVLSGVGAYEGGKFAMSRALNNPKVADWLVKTPQAELDAISRIKGSSKVKIINTLTDAAIANKVQPSPAAKALLGPANVARIMGATAGVSNVHNRKDALELMGR
jgi:hypothetical protein